MIHFVSNLAKETFIESHGRSAPQEDIDKYILEKYPEEILKEELRDPANIYHLVYYNGELVGFSKIILNCPFKKVTDRNTAKLDRVFLLKRV